MNSGGVIKLIGMTFVITLLSINATSAATSSASEGSHFSAPVSRTSNSFKYQFAFVSNFESGTLGAWKSESGSPATIVTTPNYSGEPALKSVATPKKVQTDYAAKGIETDISYTWFQVAIYYASLASTSKGYFGLGSNKSNFVAMVGVQNGDVVAGANLSSLQVVEPIPTGTAYPTGWVVVAGWIMNNFDSSSTMRIYVDRSDVVATNAVPISDVDQYTGALIETTSGTAYYTNIVLQTIQDASNHTGSYAQMGYGQGSGGNLEYLPPYYNLTAKMTLYNWSAVSNNTLSFQMNAMNIGATKASTCNGFFQLGVDFNTGGAIAPWHVNGKNCGAIYFKRFPGMKSPFPSQLVLSIVWNSTTKQVMFKVVDESTKQTFIKSISYTGGAFYGVNTQLEFPLGVNTSSFTSYKMQGSLYDFQITLVGSKMPQNLNSTYMLPYLNNAPPTWDPTFYNNALSGYNQTST